MNAHISGLWPARHRFIIHPMRSLKPLLLAAPLALVPLKALVRDGGPFSFTHRVQVAPKEKSLLRELFAGSGPERSPFGDGPSSIHR